MGDNAETNVVNRYGFSHEAPNLASAMNIGAFNHGNAVGAALGGAVIDAGLGLPAVSVAGAATSAVGLVMLLLVRRKRTGTAPQAAQ